MDYHNCNKTPLDRIDEVLLKELHDLEYNNGSDFTCNQKSEGQCIKNNNIINKRNFRCGNCTKYENYSCKNSTADFPDSVSKCCEKRKFTNFKLNGVPLAMLYSPYQGFEDLYDIDEAFNNGTLFKNLDLPFYMSSCRGINNEICENNRVRCKGDI